MQLFERHMSFLPDAACGAAAGGPLWFGLDFLGNSLPCPCRMGVDKLYQLLTRIGRPCQILRRRARLGSELVISHNSIPEQVHNLRIWLWVKNRYPLWDPWHMEPTTPPPGPLVV